MIRPTIQLILMLGCGLAWAAAAYAHGGGAVRVSNQPLGDYVLSVWTSPDPLRQGDIHVTVAVAADEQPVLDLPISVSYAASDGADERIVVPATHANAANRFYYEADLTIDRAGSYSFQVSIDGVAQNVGFVADVQPAPRFSGSVILLLLLLLLAVGGGLLLRSRRN